MNTTVNLLEHKYQEAAICLAVSEGELTEVQAANMLGVKVVDLRAIKIRLIQSVIPNYSYKWSEK